MAIKFRPGLNWSYSKFWNLFSVALLVLLAALIRLALADYSLWYDEYASLHFAREPLTNLWSEWMVRETNPPLFYTLLKAWLVFGPDSRTAIRLLPIIGGIGQVVLLATICWRWFGPRAAIMVAILGGLAPASIYFSHLVRSYIFASDAALLSLLGLLLALDYQGRRRAGGWLLYVAGCTAGIYFHTTMFIWPFAVTLTLAICHVTRLERLDTSFIQQFLVANLAILGLSAWWLHISLEQMHVGLRNLAWNKPVGPREFIRLVLGSCFLTIEPYDRDKIVTTLLPLLTLGTIAWLRHDARVRLVAMLFLVTLLTFGVLGAIKPIVIQRTLYWMSIFPLLILAAGLGRFPFPRWAFGGVAGTGLLLANNLRVHYPEYQAQDWDGALTVLAADRNSVTLVQSASMLSGLSEACLLRFGRSVCPFRVVQIGDGVKDPVQAPARWHQAVADLQRSISAEDRIYALHSYDYDPFSALAVRWSALPTSWKDQFLQGPVPPAALFPGPTQQVRTKAARENLPSLPQGSSDLGRVRLPE